MLKRISLVLSGVLLTSLCVFADASTQWTITATTAGSYSYAGGASSLIASGIPVASVEGLSTPSKSNTAYTITDGSLSFATGAYNGNGSDWSWGPSTSHALSLTGCIAGVTAASCNGSNNVVLVSDDFQSVSISPIGTTGDDRVVFGNLSGMINPTVAAFFGISPYFNSQSSMIDTAKISSSPGSSFSNAPNVAPGGSMSLVVAENWSVVSTLALLAFGIGIFGAVVRFGLIKRVELC